MADKPSAPGSAGTSSPTRYRFRVRSSDGQEIVSQVIELLSRDARLKNPRWGDGTTAATSHSKELEMKVDARGLDGRQVRFMIDRLENGEWVPHEQIVAPVKDGVAVAKHKAKHPAHEIETASGKYQHHQLAPVPLRFKVDLVDPA